MLQNLVSKGKNGLENNDVSQSAGFEPARGDPIGFQVQRLNHSATAASYKPCSKETSCLF